MKRAKLGARSGHRPTGSAPAPRPAPAPRAPPEAILIPAWASDHPPPIRASLDLGVDATAHTATWLRHQLRAWLTEDVPPAAIHQDLIDDLVLATYEAIANTVDHAYTHLPAPGPVWLLAHRCVDAVHIQITDHGRWRAIPAPGPRGRGLPVIQALIAQVHIETTTTGTTIYLRSVISPTNADRI